MTPAASRFGSTYVVGDVLAVGGMGIVHAASQRSLARAVALKVPRSELAGDPEVRARLRLEALAAARVDHRNVVRVLDLGTHEGVPFLVMDRIVGPRLGEVVLACGRLSTSVAVALLRQLLSGLAEVHASGVIHGDVKCDNVLVATERDGSASVRLVDFGLARLAATAAGYNAEVVTGTAEYLAPELIVGGPTSFASDVYATGVILYELMTGTTPFVGGSTAEVMERALSEVAPPMSWRCPDCEISVELDDVVSRALASDPAERFADGEAFLRALVAATGLAAEPTMLPADAPRSASVTRSAPTAPMLEPRRVGDPRIDHHRRAIAENLTTNDGAAIVVAYLGLARVFVEQHELASAIAELEQGVTVLSRSIENAPIWRLLLTLAALYDGRGDRVRARETTRDARDHAIRAQSKLGRDRADRLWSRLARTRHAH